jgi:hypothetical protein
MLCYVQLFVSKASSPTIYGGIYQRPNKKRKASFVKLNMMRGNASFVREQCCIQSAAHLSGGSIYISIDIYPSESVRRHKSRGDAGRAIFFFFFSPGAGVRVTVNVIFSSTNTHGIDRFEG